MKNKFVRHTAFILLAASAPLCAQQINDHNTPLHLMKPAYRIDYGLPAVDEVKATMDRVLTYIDGQTPATLVDSRTGKEVADYSDIDRHTHLKQGGFRLTSYE